MIGSSRTGPLDIEQVFGLGFRQKRTDVRTGCARRASRSAPGKEPPGDGNDQGSTGRRAVRTDWFDGRPKELEWAGRRLSILEVVGVRDETAAFPVVTGPRTVFDVQTSAARLQLAYRHRTRRWTIEGLDSAQRAA
jgi:hypothetical protein